MRDLAAKITGETNVIEVMGARMCIDPELAALCAPSMLPDEVVRLCYLAQHQVEVENPQAAELLDASLHRLIAQCARNRALITAYALLDRIRSNADWVQIRARSRSHAFIKASHSEHMAIIDAIGMGHVDVALQAMRDHLETRFGALRTALETQHQAEN
jgi:GntR family transcriptional repressor for pyruvate dehydrogenase complex